MSRFILTGWDAPTHFKVREWSGVKMQNHGWIKLHRKLLDWEWYDDIPVKVLFIHILISANHKPKRWRGIDIQSGQLLTGVDSLSKETGLSRQQTRTAISKLISTGEITRKSSNKHSIITVTCWNEHQDINKQDNHISTTEQQASNKQATANKNDNNKKNDNNTYTSDFDEFWKLYPRTVGKKAAFKSYKTALKEIDHGQLIERTREFAEAHRKAGTEQQYIPHATTWLNGGRWDDDFSQIARKSENTKKKTIDGRTSGARAFRAAAFERLSQEDLEENDPWNVGRMDM